MIGTTEIMSFARQYGLTANVIEKDYVIGWVLTGINNNPALFTSWIFKGGTCLKKCYFETYRFSEDLDFTLSDAQQLDMKFLKDTLFQLAGWVYEKSSIEIPGENIVVESYTNPQGKQAVKCGLSYLGPMKPVGDLPKIWLDLTCDEVVVLESCTREVRHQYSDKPEVGINIRCYCYEEIFAEKLRALTERMNPRDLYDTVHLYRQKELLPNREDLLNTFKKKCEFKGVNIPTFEELNTNPKRAFIESQWSNMLGHQLPALPPFVQFWEELPKLFNWLYKGVEEKGLDAISSESESTQLLKELPVSQYDTPLELIKYAAANRLLVDLRYKGSNRLIEPYSLRRTREGKVLLYAIKHQTGETRAYDLNRIENAKVTDNTFIPRFRVEGVKKWF